VENFRSFFADLARWLLDLIWNGVGALGGAISVALLIYQYKTATTRDWPAILGVVLVTLVASAFATWRKERSRRRVLQKYLDALNVPGFESSLIEYAWIGDNGADSSGVFVHLCLSNVGAPSTVGAWQVSLDLPERKVAGLLQRLPKDLSSDAIIYRVLRDAQEMSGEISRDFHYRTMLYAVFTDVSAGSVDASALRVSFRDRQNKFYEIAPDPTVVQRAAAERGTEKPYTGDNYAERMMRAVKSGPYPEWRNA